jgi:transcriptional regulator with PAS, ATPase and Fis domain
MGKNVRGITQAAKSLFMAYDWPGNIRELENVLERAVLVTTANFIRVQDIPTYISRRVTKQSPQSLTLDEVEKNHIQSVLTITGGNRTKAASILGISRRALYRKILKYNLK